MKKKDAAAYLAKCVTLMAKHGMIVQVVMTNPQIAYSIGLSKKAGAEIFIMGIDFNSATQILNSIHSQFEAGRIELIDGQDLVEIAQGFTLKLKDSPPELASHLNVAKVLLGKTPKFLQVVYPDENHIFPWDSGCSDNVIRCQDVLGVLEQL